MSDSRARLAHAHFSHPDAVQRYAARADQGLRGWEQAVVERYFQPVGRLLDIGCGGGREAIALALLGYEVTAVDISEAQVRSARALSMELGLDITIHLVNGERFFLPDHSFEHVLIASQALGNTPSLAARQTLLAECARLLAPGGVVAFSAHNRAVVEPLARQRGIVVDPAEYGITLEPGDMIVRDTDADPASPPCFYHYFDQQELADLCAAAGLRVIALARADAFVADGWPELFIGVAQRNDEALA